MPAGEDLFRWLTRYDKNPNSLRKIIWQHLRAFRAGRQLWLAMASALGPGGFGIQSVFTSNLWAARSPYEIDELLSSDVRSRQPIRRSCQEILISLASSEKSSHLYDVCIADASLCGRFGVFAKAGLMCRAHGLTLREPYLSRPMMEFMLRLPDEEKVGGSFREQFLQKVPSYRTKLALRKAVEGMLPDEIVHEKKKQGFEPPLADWLRTFTRGRTARHLFKSLFNGNGWFDEKYLDTVIKEHNAGKEENQFLLILLAGIDQWHRIYIEGGGQKPSWTWREYID
jgi:hypothetical protein